MFQIVFNALSASELSQLDTFSQLDLLDQFKVNQEILSNSEDDRFGKIEREGKTLYRFRSDDQRVYFEVEEDRVIVHRILSKNSIADFLFRSSLPMASEDEELASSKHFWSLIDEGKAAKSV